MQTGVSIRKLKDIETTAVALVKRGANKRRYALTKGDNMQISTLLVDIIKMDMGSGLDEQAIVDLCTKAGLEPQAVEAFKAMAKIGSAYKDDPAMQSCIQQLPSLLGISSESEDSAEDDAEDSAEEETQTQPNTPEIGKEKEPNMADKTEDVKKADDLKVALEKAEKSAADSAAKLTAMEEVSKSQAETLKKMQDDLTKERDERNLVEWVVKSEKDLAFVPNKTAKELGEMFHKLEKSAGRELAQSQFDIQKSMSDSIQKSALLKRAGVLSNGTPGTKGAYEQLEEKAASLIEKADTGKSEAVRKAAAMSKAIDMFPDLYKAYLDENAAQTGKRS